jgi:hypothetical protein
MMFDFSKEKQSAFDKKHSALSSQHSAFRQYRQSLMPSGRLKKTLKSQSDHNTSEKIEGCAKAEC